MSRATTRERTVETAVQALRARGARVTAPRRAVLDALATGAGHPTADDVLAEVTRRSPGVHRASVYRALDSLVGVGLVRHVHMGHGPTAYHLALDEAEAHLHARCRACDRVVDLPHDLLDGVAGTLRDHAGFVLDPEHVALSGLCRECSARG